MASDRRHPGLDALRGFAIISVIIGHGYSDMMQRKAVGFPVMGSWAGVDLFFVLSGFFIGRQLFTEHRTHGTIQLGRFWLKRGLRVWPAYFVVFALYTLIPIQSALRHHVWTDRAQFALSLIPYNALFIQNYTLYRWPSTWSLAIEEQFYIIFPIVLLVAAAYKKRPATLTWATIALTLVLFIEVVIRAVELRLIARPDLYLPTHVRLDGPAVGVWLAWVWAFRPDVAALAARVPSWLVAVTVLAAWTLASQRGSTMPLDQIAALRYPALAIAFGLWVAVAASRKVSSNSAPPLIEALAKVGEYSYCLYLTQAVIREAPFYYTIEARAESAIGGAAGMLLFMASSAVTAVLLSHCVERPWLRARDKWLARRETPRTPVGAASERPVIEPAF